ncbi:MAG TPA: HIT family protein [Candidatus Saccharimonadales bacterium]|nr:HIT family protein [Candidatus Saccharimonadales bacterium]
MTDKSLFEKIADNEIPSYKVWEDDKYLAFLTPFPSTPGLTVVVPKKNLGAYVFDLSDKEAAGLMTAARKVAKLLEKAMGVPKVALVFEGEGVPHVHAKLYPMHNPEVYAKGAKHHVAFYPEYPGYITTVDGPAMSEDELVAIRDRIRKAAHEG